MEVYNHRVKLGDDYSIISIGRDITERKKAEEEIQLKARLLDAAGDMIYLHDLTGKIIYANDATCKSHGYARDEVMQMNVRNLLTPERTEMVSPIAQETLEKGEVKFETTHVCKDGSLMPLEIHNSLTNLSGDDYGIISIARDITERKKAEEQMMVTSRLASIGELASGVAHEINNPLTSVIGFSELLLERPLPNDIKEDLTTIRGEAQRAANIVKNLLTFARKHPESRQSVKINDIIFADIFCL
jgi:PAS domain S-box-containing protein